MDNMKETYEQQLQGKKQVSYNNGSDVAGDFTIYGIVNCKKYLNYPKN